jgi:Transposase DDE domain
MTLCSAYPLPIKDWSKSRHLVIDSTGVKVYGEGEWKVRQHGIGKRRTWRKLHFCAAEATLEIISVVASTNDQRCRSPAGFASGRARRDRTSQRRRRLVRQNPGHVDGVDIARHGA